MDILVSFAPIIVLWVIMGAIFLSIARRKGVSTGSVIIGSFPIWGYFYGVWLASLTDTEVKERLGIHSNKHAS